jgi:hypothetical protein
VLRAWVAQLAPGGLLAIEELESSHYSLAEIDALEAELRELADKRDPAVFVDYHMRQMVLR